MEKNRNYSDGRPFEYSKQKHDLSNAYVSAKYKDGTILEPLSKYYKELDRTKLEEVVIKSGEHVPLYTLKIVDEQFAYRKRSFAKPFEKNGQWTLDHPKRCIILVTKGKVVFYWDSGEVYENTKWQNDAIYNKRDIEIDP